MVVFTGISGSGKSSLAFGTLYAEAQRRYLESIAPYARRLIQQMAIPDVDYINGLSPAVALQQHRSSGNVRSSVGSVTTLSSLLRILYSRAGSYPEDQGIIYAEGFSPNNPEGACPNCQGLGQVFEVSEESMVPDDSLTIRNKAIAAWNTGWSGQNQRDILISLGYDVDIPWRNLSKKTRDWILFSDDQPVAPIYPGLTSEQVKKAVAQKLRPAYMGTFSSAKRHVLHTFRNSPSASMKKRVSQFLRATMCPVCEGKRLCRESLSVTFAGLDIAEMNGLEVDKVFKIFEPYTEKKLEANNADDKVVNQIAFDITTRLRTIMDLGLGYLTLERNTPTLSPGELQRLRLATQLGSKLFGVTYVLDEPASGLHPADTQSLLKVLRKLKDLGNSLFIVEHEMEIIRHADWIVDIGPLAGDQGGKVVYSGPADGLKDIVSSETARYLAEQRDYQPHDRTPKSWLKLSGITKNNLLGLDVSFPLGAFTSITGVSGSGKSSLVSQALVDLVYNELGMDLNSKVDESEETADEISSTKTVGNITFNKDHLKRLVVVDQKPIGRTPKSNLATYTGFFDQVRSIFAKTSFAKTRGYDIGRFSFNVSGGRCENCRGEGSVMVELLFLPSVYVTCPICKGARYNEETLEVKYKKKSIAEILQFTVTEALDFFADVPSITRSLKTINQVGLGYLKLGQSSTELSGGEAQRIKLSTELQRINKGDTLYILDEPTTGLHPSDVDKLLFQLNSLVDKGNTVITVEHVMDVIVQSDWIIDIGPGAGAEGGKVVVEGKPSKIAIEKNSKTGFFLQSRLGKG